MNNRHTIIGIFILLSVTLGSLILGNAYKYKFKSSQTITVTGNAKMDFEADIVKWSATFSKINFDLKTASEQLKNDREIIKNYLISKGISENEFRFGAVDIYKDYLNFYDEKSGANYSKFNGYNLSQNVSIASSQLDKVDNVSREISDLISQGIELSSQPANYYYSKLEDLKLKLIASAAENARLRAENIAKQANSNIGELVKADLGVFQITGEYDDEDYSYGGVFNTTSRAKTANVTVKMNFRSN
ncbi:MAG: SIMPL domain-containing protein [Chitinophagales bacterium]|nr:SIMPL domain-containing protein [Chitinophagales bacterium]